MENEHDNDADNDLVPTNIDEAVNNMLENAKKTAAVRDKESHINNLDSLLKHIDDYNLNLKLSSETKSDGNCLYNAIADQITMHNLPDLPRDSDALRLAVIALIPSLPQASHWTNILGSKIAMDAFLKKHSQDCEWTDSMGIMCQATALLVSREVRLVGTANIGQPGLGYTTMESGESAKDLEPLTIGYLQNKHFQSLLSQKEPGFPAETLLAEHDEIYDNTTLEESTDDEITHKAYDNERVIQDFSNCRTDEGGNLLASDDESEYDADEDEETDDETIIEIYNCKSCNFSSKCERNLNTHKIKEHIQENQKTMKRKLPMERSQLPLAPAKKISKSEQSFKCHICDKIFRINYNLKRHVKSVH